MAFPMSDGAPDPEAMAKMFSDMFGQVTAMVKPMLKSALIAAQEDPDTAFVSVIGGEIMIDFDKLVNLLLSPPEGFGLPGS